MLETLDVLRVHVEGFADLAGLAVPGGLRLTDGLGDGALEEERVLAERDLVAPLQSLGARQALAVEEGAVGGAEILDGPTPVVLQPDLSLTPGDRDVVDHDMHVFGAADIGHERANVIDLHRLSFQNERQFGHDVRPPSATR